MRGIFNRSRLFSVCVAGFAFLVFAGCSGRKGPVGKGPVPREFYDLSAQFAQLAGTDRLELGRKLSGILPTCESSPNADGMLTVDHNSPSYVLTRDEAIQRLGKPTQVVEGGDLIYHLGEDFRRNWYLSVEFHEDHVIVSRIYSVRKSNKQRAIKKAAK